MKNLIKDVLGRHSNPANQCLVMHDFSRFISADQDSVGAFCSDNFENDEEKEVKIAVCHKFFTEFGAIKGSSSSGAISSIPTCQQDVLGPILAGMKNTTQKH